jgi:methoxymalonate biosynthesis acyl carrier protein
VNSSGDDLTERVHQLFVEALTMDVPSPDTDLIETGRLDSLALVELLFALEQRFGVDLSLGELDVENFRTLRRISDFVAAQTSTDATGTSG